MNFKVKIHFRKKKKGWKILLQITASLKKLVSLFF